MQKEIWKDVPDYDGVYQVSDSGRVRSMKSFELKSLKTFPDKSGYLMVNFYYKKRHIRNKVHRLVLKSFVGSSPLPVDHINRDKGDNRLENLEYVTHRENCARRCLAKKSNSSKYTGVSWFKHINKWGACIYLNGKSRHLGVFLREEDASKAYMDVVNNPPYKFMTTG